jgi:hypothetical protein
MLAKRIGLKTQELYTAGISDYIFFNNYFQYFQNYLKIQ